MRIVVYSLEESQDNTRHHLTVAKKPERAVEKFFILSLHLLNQPKRHGIMHSLGSNFGGYYAVHELVKMVTD